jgi:hypothetical protein
LTLSTRLALHPGSRTLGTFLAFRNSAFATLEIEALSVVQASSDVGAGLALYPEVTGSKVLLRGQRIASIHHGLLVHAAVLHGFSATSVTFALALAAGAVAIHGALRTALATS